MNEKYKNNKTEQVVIVSDKAAAGMCTHTLGKTLYIYKEENSNLPYSFIMEAEEFNRKFTKIK